MNVTTLEEQGVIEYTRQRDWYDPASNPDARVTVVGAGGIGSFASLALGKLGIANLHLIDFDQVEAHNVPNQMFTLAQVGDYKVEAVANSIREYAGDHINVSTTEHSLEEALNGPQHGLFVSALDSMAARAALWDRLKFQVKVPLLLDARLGGESIVIYAVNPSDYEDGEGYEATLHSDAEAVEASCTAQSVIDVGFAVASLLTRHTRTFLASGKLPAVTMLDMHGLNLYTQETW
jgi:hypothetical protein